MSDINFNVIKNSYGWTISVDGEVLGLIAGDLAYEPTGIKLDGDSLEIWNLGIAAWKKLKAEKDGFGKECDQAYKEVCKCGRVITLYTQRDEYPEYRTNVHVKCSCGELVLFTLPVN